MTNSKTKPAQKDNARSLFALDVLSGRKTEPDYEGYRREKRRIERLAMSWDEYDAAIKDAVRRYGI